MDNIDPTKTNSLGWAYAPGHGPSRGEVDEDIRIAQEVAQEQADRQRLDAQARRHSYQWKLRSMKQRGRRY